MPLDRFVLILVIVIAAAGVTVWVAAMAFALGDMPRVGLGIVAVLGLVAYVLARVISDRVTSKEDDKYDRLDR